MLPMQQEMSPHVNHPTPALHHLLQFNTINCTMATSSPLPRSILSLLALPLHISTPSQNVGSEPDKSSTVHDLMSIFAWGKNYTTSKATGHGEVSYQVMGTWIYCWLYYIRG
jgi:hypothetical protein